MLHVYYLNCIFLSRTPNSLASREVCWIQEAFRIRAMTTFFLFFALNVTKYIIINNGWKHLGKAFISTTYGFVFVNKKKNNKKTCTHIYACNTACTYTHMQTHMHACMHTQWRQPRWLLDAPSDWRPGGRGFNPRRVWQHSFVENDLAKECAQYWLTT